jgi:thioredoxin-dependent peroxiredoxin
MASKKTDLKVGDKAPAFCIPDKDKKETCLESFKGKWVVLYFYPRDDTPGCTMEAMDFTESLDDFVGRNAVILGMSTDSPESHCRFYDKYKLKLTLLSDTEKTVVRDYGVLGKLGLLVDRTTFLINPQGKIAHIWRSVKVQDHIDEVRARLDELQAKH